MRRTTRLLLALTLAAVAVPLVPFLLFGTRLDHIVSRWLEPRPTAAVLALVEVAVLAADLLLPVPSSMVATLGGAELGIALGTCCAWLGMTAGSLAGWWLGKTAGSSRASARQQHRLGPLLVILSRPLPLVAEAAALVAGAAGMRLRDFFAAVAAGNLAIAFVWTAAGALGARADSLQWMLALSLALPVAASWLVARRRFWEDPLPDND